MKTQLLPALCILAIAPMAFAVSTPSASFTEVTDKSGITSIPAWKYGGPSIADLNGDGHYELLLGNHDHTPIQLFWANTDSTYTEHSAIHPRSDLHGIAAGDYDLDGDADVIIMLGGGNGATPQPPRLLRNDDGTFTDVTIPSGLSEMGARGRSPRWIDLNSDGYLDLIQINAAQVLTEQGPRNLVFENNHDGTFRYRSSPAFEKLEGEKALVTDFNGDHIPDLVAFSPLSLWQGNDDFTFTNVTSNWLPETLASINFVNAVAQADIDNDGDIDLYLARGKTYYQTANNALSFDHETHRLDLRDEGNKSHDGISFIASETISLSDFSHWPRGNNITLPVYLGSSKQKIDTPKSVAEISAKKATGFPEDTSEDAWFLGYLGNGKWRLEWNLNSNLAWDIRASVTGVEEVIPDWPPQKLGEPDFLLRNDGQSFTDISAALPPESQDNNWGVITADFNNDSRNDFFVYRFGELIWRAPDALLLNQGNNSFTSHLLHGANHLPEKSHGDMGAAFDYNHDGQIDIFSGDDDNGLWRMYQNNGDNDNNYLVAQIGYSPKGTDPYGAEVTIATQSGIQSKRVGSTSATHSQSLLNSVHFGLGSDKEIQSVSVRWRDGTTSELRKIASNQRISLGGN